MNWTHQYTDKELRQRISRRLALLGLMDNRADVLAPYKVTGLRQLDRTQMDDLYNKLYAMEIQPKKSNIDQSPLRKKRSVVLGLCGDLGIQVYNGDWGQLNEFLAQPRIAGKLLYEMDSDELDNCALRLRAMIAKRKSEQQEFDRLKLNN